MEIAVFPNFADLKIFWQPDFLCFGLWVLGVLEVNTYKWDRQARAMHIIPYPITGVDHTLRGENILLSSPRGAVVNGS